MKERDLVAPLGRSKSAPLQIPPEKSVTHYVTLLQERLHAAISAT
jgi:hypothetical protein